MKALRRWTLLIPLALLAAPAAGQEYWEYSPWEGEWERNDPVAGLEYEYEDGFVEAEEEAYEWEAGEGYHEEEWYDPSDWFDDDSSVDYEDDSWGYYDDYGYDYDDYGYGYGYDYDNYDYDLDYNNWAWDDRDDVDYEADVQAKGQIESLKRIQGAEGAPRSVRLTLRTDDGEQRTLHLGDVGYVERYLPEIKKGDRIVIGGQNVQVNGRRMFKGKEIRTPDGSYMIPDYEYNRRIEGRLTGLKKVRLREGNVEAVVAKVKPWQGKTINVLLGPVEDLRAEGRSIRPGSRVRVEGYRREVDGESTFVVQDVKSLEQQQDDSDNQRRQQSQRSARRN